MSGFGGSSPVQSVNGRTGAITLASTDVGAAPATALTSTVAGVVYTAGAYPTRPTGRAFVIFVGPVDPGSAALDGDLWIAT